MNGLVSVDAQIYEKQGHKIVLGPDEEILEVPAGQPAPPGGEVLALAGEPAFELRLPGPLDSDEDIPDSLGLALRTVAERLCTLSPDGCEVDGWVEGCWGPVVQDGTVRLWLDTDGKGFAPDLIDAMIGVFLEELTPLSIEVEISAGPSWPERLEPTWRSTTERGAQ